MISSEIQIISKTFSSIINELVAEHYSALTQEHQLSSRIGQRLEDKLNYTMIDGRKFSVITQDIPDKGPGSLEKKIGVDLYICISVDGPDGFSKGIFVQSKWQQKAKWGELSSQCEHMLDISKSSYVWLYGPSGVTVINAAQFRPSRQKPILDMPKRRLDTVTKQLLICKEGDTSHSVPLDENRRFNLTTMLKQLDVNTGIDIAVSQPFQELPAVELVAPIRPRVD